eukprot:TRINITY_DN10372_c0_g1_i1.p1 TRINITY_DN10372_c0_g1~~TRINITY_DN10372_c0_g1_i1.p1  ORF type:complete len:466 (+),score=48.98 TRINITY_DN10372_c0_g1_i1:31-1398(+)
MTDLGNVLGASTPNKNVPHVEYLWDTISYMGGVSGGSWFIGSFSDLLEEPQAYLEDLYVRLASPVEDLPGGASTWLHIFENWFLLPQNIPESIMSIYGPVILSHLLAWDPPHPANASHVNVPGLEQRLSGAIAKNIADFGLPYPIISAANVQPDFPESIFPNFYEFGPYEIGSVSPGKEGWIPSQCFNTHFESGKIPTGVTPYSGDNLAIILGTAGSGPFALTLGEAIGYACNAYCDLDCLGLCGWIEKELNSSTFGERLLPGKFNNFLKGTGVKGPLNEEDTFIVIDQGLTQNLPLMPLVSRGLDYIFAVDAGQPAIGGPPTGKALVHFDIYAQANGLPFPTIPKYFNSSLQAYTLPKEYADRQLIFGSKDKAVPTIVYLPLLRNATLTPNDPDFYPFFSDGHTSFTKTEIATMVELNKGLIQQTDLIESLKCLLQMDLGIEGEVACECSICVS